MAKPKTKKATVSRKSLTKNQVGGVKVWILKSTWSKLALYWMIVFCVLSAFFFSQVLIKDNYLIIFPSVLIMPTIMNALSATIIALVVWLIPRPRTVGGKTLTTLFLALNMVAYDTRLASIASVFRAIVPLLPKPDDDLPIISLLFLLTLLIIGVGIGMVVDRLQLKYANTNKNAITAVAIIVGVLFFSQALKTANLMSQIMKESSYQATAELQQASKMHPSNTGDKPDIYYIVLEDYVSNDVLKSQFNADNSTFMNLLRDEGFSVNEHAMSQYPKTASSIASVLNLSYHNDDLKTFKDNATQSATLFFNMNRQAEATKLLKQQGYQYYQLGNGYGAVNQAPLATVDYSSATTLKIFGFTKQLRDLEIPQFEQSPYFRFAKIPFRHWPLQTKTVDQPTFVAEQLTTLNQLANNKQQGGRFIFADILVPHELYYFNADGSFSTTPNVDNVGKPIKQKYVAQTQFINGQMQTLVSAINKNSGGKAVVLLISDEGQSPALMNQSLFNPAVGDVSEEENEGGNMPDWSAADLQMKFGIMQAVKIPKASTEDLQHMAPVNAFRIVLDRYFGYTFGYLPDCQFGLKDVAQYWYDYADLTSKVTSKDASSCKPFD